MERSAKIAATSSRAVPGLLSEVADASGSRATVACSMRGERLGGVGGVGSVGGIGGCGGVGGVGVGGVGFGGGVGGGSNGGGDGGGRLAEGGGGKGGGGGGDGSGGLEGGGGSGDGNGDGGGDGGSGGLGGGGASPTPRTRRHCRCTGPSNASSSRLAVSRALRFWASILVVLLVTCDRPRSVTRYLLCSW